MTIDPTKTYTATVGTNLGTIVIALDPKESPEGPSNSFRLPSPGTSSTTG